jgi:hypothetical protein
MLDVLLSSSFEQDRKGSSATSRIAGMIFFMKRCFMGVDRTRIVPAGRVNGDPGYKSLLKHLFWR